MTKSHKRITFKPFMRVVDPQSNQTGRLSDVIDQNTVIVDFGSTQTIYCNAREQLRVLSDYYRYSF